VNLCAAVQTYGYPGLHCPAHNLSRRECPGVELLHLLIRWLAKRPFNPPLERK
jgi:hypothetical protein